jgi:hypothetical protein
MTEEIDIERCLRDRLWRLCNLYSIKSADTGQIIPFVPRAEQLELFRALLSGVRKVVVLKARRLGMSTAIDVFAADEVIFHEGVQCSIVDQTQDDATKKLVNIVRVAFDSLPEAIRKNFTMNRENDSAFVLRSVADDALSGIYAGKNARGGTNQFLHISEWGVIQADDPRRSEEILTGALPSAEHGTTVIETTWKGGRGGHLWKIVKSAMELPAEQRTANDWHLFFFPWWTDPTYTEAGSVADIDAETAKYLGDKEAEIGRKFTDGQKCWYARRKKTLGIFIFREFPTTIDECFRAPIEGAIYADIIDRLRGQGAIRTGPVDTSALVHTFWDLGSPLNTVTWFVQFVGAEVRVIDCDCDLDLTPIARVARILAKGYPLGSHYLPHDAGATQKSGKTFQTELSECGLPNTRVIPQTHDVWVGINRLRQILPRFSFRLPNCERGIEALSNYHTRRESSGGIASDAPVHDWSSHCADAARMIAEAEMAGMIQGGSSMGKTSRQTTVRTGFRGDSKDKALDPIDAYFAKRPRVRVLR